MHNKINELEKLATEKALYEAHGENPQLQHQELRSIANAVLYVTNSMNEEEYTEYSELVNWAKSY